MGAPTAPAICTRSLRSRRPRRSSLNVEPASSWSTQEVASQPERSIEHLAYACRCPTTTQGPDRSAQAQGCIPQMWVIGSVCGAPCGSADEDEDEGPRRHDRALLLCVLVVLRLVRATTAFAGSR